MHIWYIVEEVVDNAGKEYIIENLEADTEYAVSMFSMAPSGEKSIETPPIRKKVPFTGRITIINALGFNTVGSHSDAKMCAI